MSLILKDRVRETSTVSGTNDATLLGAVTGFQSFSAVGNGNTCYYCIADQSGGSWEVGIGTYSNIGPTLTRDTILSSSNSGSKVVFAAGSKDVFLTYPSEVAVLQGTSVSFQSIIDSALTSGRVTYAGTSGVLQDSANLTFDGTTLTANALAVTNGTTITGGTANGVAYLNGSKVLTTGSALTFDGSLLSNEKLQNYQYRALFNSTNYCDIGYFGTNTVAPSNPFRVWYLNGSEQMRLTSTGLGIGTSSPSYKLDVAGAARSDSWIGRSNTSAPTTDAFIYRPADNTLGFGTGSTERMRLDSSGNLGLGVTPSAWYSGWKAFEIGSGNAIWRVGAQDFRMSSNLYNDGSNSVYKANGYAASYIQSSGAHLWSTAPSGTAGNAITFTQAMTLDASGNLGIGSTSPVSFGANTHGITLDGTGNYQHITWKANGTLVADAYTNGTSGFIFGTEASAPLQFQTAGTERMRIDSSGNVGIGTTTMSGKLNVIGGPTYWGYTAAQGYLSYSSGEPVIGSVAGQGLRIYTNNTEAMRIDSSGNVGIGTSSPAQKLHVASAGTTAVQVQNTASTGAAYIKSTNTATTCNFGVDAAGGYVETLGAYSTLFYTNGSERMRINSSGNVGIGTSSPSEKLQVVGTVKSNYFDTTAGSGYDAFQMGSDSVYPWYVYQHTAGLYRIALDGSGNLKFNSGYGSVATAYGCRAWVNFNGTGTVAIRASGNVSSITDNGTGLYTVNFSTAMPDANYAPAHAVKPVSGGNGAVFPGIVNSVNLATTGYRIITVPAGASAVDTDVVSAAVFR